MSFGFFQQFLGTIPTTLGNLTALEFLEVSSNFLTGRLPTEMGNLRDVTELLFEENSLLTNIPTELGSLEKLEVMRGGGNVILSLPSELGRMTSARILTLQDGSTAGTIPSEIGQLTDLRKLRLVHDHWKKSTSIVSSCSDTHFIYLSLSFSHFHDHQNC